MSPVEYPTVQVGGKAYQLRFAHSAFFLLQSWGYQIGDPAKPVPVEVLAAAALGTIDKKGEWRSAGLTSVFDLLDLMIPGVERLPDLVDPVMDALKKAAPKADLALVPSLPSAAPAESEAVN
jgi:hypothetical protein